MQGEYRSDDSRWQAVAARDAGADGAFWYGVLTTGVYCLPSCPSRRPRRENVRFFDRRDQAAHAGFRPCRRCRPEDPAGADPHAGAVADICRWIEQADEAPTLAAMAARAGLSAGHFHRIFRRILGVTPKQFCAAVRARRAEAGLKRAATVTRAIYGAGFNGPSGFYDTAIARLGMRPGAWRKGGQGMAIRWATGTCTLGRVLVAATERGICAILLGDDDAALAAELARRFPAAALEGAEAGSAFEAWVRATVAFVDRPAPRFDLPLDLQGTAFQEKVWRALLRVPPGATTSYAALAAAIGQPGSARAVARAVASNPAAVVIPCHRALRADGALAGYRWGVDRKRALLEREAAEKGG